LLGVVSSIHPFFGGFRAIWVKLDCVFFAQSALCMNTDRINPLTGYRVLR
jgi:hypothetical protein